MELMKQAVNLLCTKWNGYKYRLTPWLVFNFKDRTVREVRGGKDKIITDEEVNQFLILFFAALENQIKTIECKSQLHEIVDQHEKTEKITSLYSIDKFEKFDHCSHCSGEDTTFNQKCNMEKEENTNYDEIVYKQNVSKMKNHIKFVTERRLSLLPSGGLGVVVTHGDIPPNTIVSMYPGTIYRPGDPILLQSLKNPFIFRCIDNIHIDGNNANLSKRIYRSCCKRDKHFGFFTSDMTWLTPYPINPLAIGQYVNNQSHKSGANVAYQEFDIPADFPFHLRKYIPNNLYSAHHGDGWLTRVVVLISLRHIKEGEELYSNYFTIVN